MESVEIEKGITGTLKAVQLKKDMFNKLVSEKPEGVEVEIKKVNNPYISYFQDPNNRSNNKKYAICLDYEFNLDNKLYGVGIHYNLGYPIKKPDGIYYKTSDNNLFNILGLFTPDIDKYEDITISFELLKGKLTGLKFIIKSDLVEGKNQNYYYKLTPVKLI